MNDPLLKQLVALSCYAWMMGFTFCDGFKLPIGKKLVWFTFFAALCTVVLRVRNEYDLTVIVPVSSLLAFGICFWERRKTLHQDGGRRLRPFRRL